MTDFDKIIVLFNELGIGYTTRTDCKDSGNKAIILEAKEGNKVIGYNGFVAEFYFTGDGIFTQVGIYE